MLHTQRPHDFHKPIPAVGCFIEHDGHFLLLERHHSRSQPKTWGLPGGKVEEGELPHDAMLREINEETGLALIHNDIEFLRDLYVRYDTHDFVFSVFRHRTPERLPIILNPGEHTAHAWESPESAKRLPLIQDQDTCIDIIYAQNRLRY